VKHKIVAVGSRSTESAEAFIQKLKESKDDSQWGVENGVLDGVKGYGSYEEVYNDPVRDFLSFSTMITCNRVGRARHALVGGTSAGLGGPIDRIGSSRRRRADFRTSMRFTSVPRTRTTMPTPKRRC